jgi:hypothetical protein
MPQQDLAQLEASLKQQLSTLKQSNGPPLTDKT